MFRIVPREMYILVPHSWRSLCQVRCITYISSSATGNGCGYDILDYFLLRSAIFNVMYRSYELARTLAQGAGRRQRHNDREYGQGYSRETWMWLWPPEDSDKVVLKLKLQDALTSIYRSDAAEITDGPTELHERYLAMREKYGSFADLRIGGSAQCTYVNRRSGKFELLNASWVRQFNPSGFSFSFHLQVLPLEIPATTYNSSETRLVRRPFSYTIFTVTLDPVMPL